MTRDTALVVVGTRPEAIKLAPVVLALRARGRLDPVIVTTGQHPDLVPEVLDLFGLTAEVDLRVADSAVELHRITAEVISRFGDLLAGRPAPSWPGRPAAVVVQGDTSSVLGAALAAFYARIPVVHLEAGLRSHHVQDPFPEEVHRRAVAILADLHLAPTTTAAARLLAEGIPATSVEVTGNTVVDALRLMRNRPSEFRDPRLRALETEQAKVVLVTAHRRESWGAPLERIALAVGQLCVAHPDVRFVVSMHPAPAVRSALAPLAAYPNLLLISPEPYSGFVRILAMADLVLTDSGGIQEEAPSLGIPVLVLRDRTERVESLDAGLARLVGTQVDRVVEAAEQLMASGLARHRESTLYGDGFAAGRAADLIAARYTAASVGQVEATRLDDKRLGATTIR